RTVYISQSGPVKAYQLEVEGTKLNLPESIFKDDERRTAALNALRVSVDHYQAEDLNAKKTGAFFEKEVEALLDEGESQVMLKTLETLIDLIDDDSNSIWLFVLSNLYAPILLKARPFDAIIGNPPWIVMHSIQNADYQEFLKK